MILRRHKGKSGLGTAVGLFGLLLLIGSFALFLDASGSALAVNGQPLLFIAALIVLRIGVLMRER